MKKLTLIGITIIMFFFKNTATANYEKIFFDHSIKSIDDKILLEIPEFSVYDTAMIWIERLNTLKIDNFSFLIFFKNFK